MSDKQSSLVGAWQRAKNNLDKYKKQESDLRKQVIETFFPNKQPLDKGTYRAPLGNGYNIKMEAKLNIKVDEPALSPVLEQLKENGHSTKLYFEYKPSLNTKVYNSLKGELRELINEALIIKTGSASIEIEPPKKDKDNG